MYQFLPMAIHTYLKEMARIYAATLHHLQLGLLYADEIHTLVPTVYAATHAYPDSFQYTQQLVV